MFVGESPIHIAANADIAEIVLMPGDPLRAKYIAENFLKDAKLVTSIRNMFGYTGYYKDKKVTVMSHGMGMPSASIYVFELIHFYNVKKIIRIGTCGAVSPKADIGDLILTKEIYSESNFAYTYSNYVGNIVEASKDLNKTILDTAKELNMELHYGVTTTMDVFGPYIDFERVLDRIPKEYEILSEEMEAFGLTHVANLMNAESTTIMTVVDSKYSKVVLTPEDRQTKLNDMITLALESIVK
ncbi:MAG: purine-nucleoside phosphorylase [Firmicutes bacterium]|nr:purine-nucleoside phosphorylase [Bacillota bacterium]